MSLSADILTLNAALNAFTYGESIVAENVANSQTPGYTAQVLNLDSVQDFGGVAVAGVGSTRDVYLYNQLYGQLALQGYTTAQLSALSQLSAILPEVSDPTATDGLNGALNNLSAAWSALSAAETGGASAVTLTGDQTAVVNDMVALAGLFNTDSNQLYTLQQNLNIQVQQAVTSVNSLEGQILSLNEQIVALGGNQSAQTSTLIDQREQDAQQLVTLTGGSVNYATNGAMIITNSFGTLVDGVTTFPLETIPSPTSPGMLDIGYVGVAVDTTPQDVTADFTSGTLGGLYAGQSNVSAAIQAINQMAAGVIQFSNEVNESGVAPDGTMNALFYGNEAANISVNPDAVSTPSYVLGGDDPNNPGNLAAVQAAVTTVNTYSEIETQPGASTGGLELAAGAAIDANASLLSQAGLFQNPAPDAGGTMVINAGGNAVNIVWTQADTLNQIVAMINAQGGGAIYATLQTVPAGASVGGVALNPGQFIHIYSAAPMSVYDASGNLASALQLGAELTSTAPIDAVPSTGVNVVNGGTALNTAPQANALALFTQPTAPVNPLTGIETGTVQVGGATGATFQWTPDDTIDGILGLINGAAPAGTTLTGAFNFVPITNAQEILLVETVNAAAGPTVANQLQSITIGDLTGNLTQVLNLNNAVNPSQTLAQLATTLRDSNTATQSEQTQANNLVSATEALQTAQSGVDVNAQLAQATVYENAYDAAVRLQYILENMLNYLITQTGSPNGDGGPVGQ